MATVSKPYKCKTKGRESNWIVKTLINENHAMYTLKETKYYFPSFALANQWFKIAIESGYTVS
jgi:hypothetical protein